MTRRFSITFAILSMILDALTIAFSLWLSTLIRPIWTFAFYQAHTVARGNSTSFVLDLSAGVGAYLSHHFSL
jgi:hypothetical protein